MLHELIVYPLIQRIYTETEIVNIWNYGMSFAIFSGQRVSKLDASLLQSIGYTSIRIEYNDTEAVTLQLKE